MLAQYDWQDANRKRSREDEYEDIATGGTLGFTEHRSVGSRTDANTPCLHD